MYARRGSIKIATRDSGLAAYVAAIVFALLLAMIATVLVVGLYLPGYYYNICYNEGRMHVNPY